jgi:hypothetical protein
VTRLGFKKVSLGSVPPKVVGIRTLDTNESCAILDLEVRTLLLLVNVTYLTISCYMISAHVTLAHLRARGYSPQTLIASPQACVEQSRANSLAQLLMCGSKRTFCSHHDAAIVLCCSSVLQATLT